MMTALNAAPCHESSEPSSSELNSGYSSLLDGLPVDSGGSRLRDSVGVRADDVDITEAGRLLWESAAKSIGTGAPHPNLTLPLSTLSTGLKQRFGSVILQAHCCFVMHKAQVDVMMKLLMNRCDANTSWTYAYRIIDKHEEERITGCDDGLLTGSGEKALSLISHTLNLDNILVAVARLDRSRYLGNHWGAKVFRHHDFVIRALLKELQSDLLSSGVPQTNDELHEDIADSESPEHDAREYASASASSRNCGLPTRWEQDPSSPSVPFDAQGHRRPQNYVERLDEGMNAAIHAVSLKHALSFRSPTLVLYDDVTNSSRMVSPRVNIAPRIGRVAPFKTPRAAQRMRERRLRAPINSPVELQIKSIRDVPFKGQEHANSKNAHIEKTAEVETEHTLLSSASSERLFEMCYELKKSRASAELRIMKSPEAIT
eukprot:GEMP01036883.1.p1 GENE.GEMP01036883.1~~GEMP01036883.1.p1  ORF type:complete len:430 (+),score=75.51 GEMP01036883.1:43-1332(+)